MQNYLASILFTRSLEAGEGASVQQEEITKVVNADVQEKEKLGFHPVGLNSVSETDSGMLKLIVSYFETPKDTQPQEETV